MITYTLSEQVKCACCNKN